MGTKGPVVAAMSGGVDSSVAAALLLERGYDVFGVTLLMHGDDPATDSSCGGAAAIESAAKVASQLGIAHQVLDARKAFIDRVLRPSWQTYQKGRTPNPCVFCNEAIKFGLLLDFARRQGAEKIATGHYVRLVDTEGEKVLARGKNADKDQSYFLYALSSGQRAATLFPLGEMTKPEVRERARDLGLASAERKESQDACFVDDETIFPEKLREWFDQPAQPGEVIDETGEILGEHQGIHRYTIGQRQGLGIALGKRAWVSHIDAPTGRVTLTTDPKRLLAKALIARQVRWQGKPYEGECGAQIRYRHQARGARVFPLAENKARVVFDEPQRAVTPGQATVWYDGDLVIGGGIIDEVEK